jgi:phage terminase small subunit
VRYVFAVRCIVAGQRTDVGYLGISSDQPAAPRAGALLRYLQKRFAVWSSSSKLSNPANPSRDRRARPAQESRSKQEKPISDLDFEPPRQLSIMARQVFDRHAQRIHAEGRWQLIDHDLLCVYAETLELYLRFKRDVDDYGTLVQGRSAQERVKNPSLVGMAQARADLIRLSRVIPIADPKPDRSSVIIDAYIDELINDVVE